MKKIYLIAFLSNIGLLGCAQNDCEKALDRADNRLLECGLAVSDVSRDEAEECGDTEAQFNQCQADCIEAAPCEALNFSDEEAYDEYFACSLICVLETS